MMCAINTYNNVCRAICHWMWLIMMVELSLQPCDARDIRLVADSYTAIWPSCLYRQWLIIIQMSVNRSRCLRSAFKIVFCQQTTKSIVDRNSCTKSSRYRRIGRDRDTESYNAVVWFGSTFTCLYSFHVSLCKKSSSLWSTLIALFWTYVHTRYIYTLNIRLLQRSASDLCKAYRRRRLRVSQSSNCQSRQRLYIIGLPLSSIARARVDRYRLSSDSLKPDQPLQPR